MAFPSLEKGETDVSTLYLYRRIHSFESSSLVTTERRE